MTREELCKKLRPEDYAVGVGFSEAGEKLAAVLQAVDVDDAPNPAADNSWGHLTAEALAEGEWQFKNMLLEGKL